MAGKGLYANIHAKENVEARCERKVLKVHQKLLTSKEQNRQRGNND